MKLTITSLILALALSSSAFAQQPTLTETEQLKIQVLNLQYALRAEQEKGATLTISYGQCSATLLKDNAALVKATTELQDEITKSHSGFRFDIQTGQFTKIEPEKK